MKATWARTRRSGFTLAEALAALIITGLASSALLLSASYCLHASEAACEDVHSVLLAQALLDEISACRWADTDQPAHWGPEAGENSGSSRAGFDDLDDYDGWTGQAQTRQGETFDQLQQRLFPAVASSELAHYRCSVQVRYVDEQGQPLQAGQTSPYREVTVQVQRDDQLAHTLSRIFVDLSELLGGSDWLWPN